MSKGWYLLICLAFLLADVQTEDDCGFFSRFLNLCSFPSNPKGDNHATNEDHNVILIDDEDSNSKSERRMDKVLNKGTIFWKSHQKSGPDTNTDISLDIN